MLAVSMDQLRFLRFFVRLMACMLVAFGWGHFRAVEADELSWSIPAAGNSFPRDPGQGLPRADRNSILRWNDTDTVVSIYFHIDRPARIGLAVEAETSSGLIPMEVAVGRERVTMSIGGEGGKVRSAGTHDLKGPGYVRVELRILESAGKATLELQGLVIRSDTEGLVVTRVATHEGNMFYWGRRGPSVHLSYVVPRDVLIEYAYSEITVAEGEDPTGSYFMANGFGEGYFGIQVNSPTERRVLFSVWSPFQTDDPRKIPDDQRVQLLAKGPGVRTGEFGNEGSGGQSYLVYPWSAGKTYRFLTQVVPDGEGSTIYTAWFGDTSENEWRLIASFRRPKTETYLRGFHSFLENFDPNTGDQMRRGQHGNVWIRSKSGAWHECLSARFSVDATGQGGHRLDFDGGAIGDRFYLRNCGFFDGTQKPGAVFERSSSSNTPPEFDLASLPRQ